MAALGGEEGQGASDGGDLVAAEGAVGEEGEDDGAEGEE